jgi:hypothetical protein
LQPDYFMARAGDKRHFRRVGFKSPRHHDSDHRAVVAQVRMGRTQALLKYWKEYRRSPLQLQTGPQDELETVFEGLKATCKLPPPRKRQGNELILEGAWAFVNKRAQL